MLHLTTDWLWFVLIYEKLTVTEAGDKQTVTTN